MATGLRSTVHISLNSYADEGRWWREARRKLPRPSSQANSAVPSSLGAGAREPSADLNWRQELLPP